MDESSPHARDSSGSLRPKFRRAPIACRRCRRLRIKCRREGAHAPCISCSQTGHECTFPQRGEADFDRAYRHEGRRKSQHSARRASPDVGIHTASSRNYNYQTPPTRTSQPRQTQGPPQSTVNEVSNPDLPLLPATSDWELLPPLDEVMEACQVFLSSYFQLGFLAKTNFFEKLSQQRESVSVFLLLSILSISARFTPSLIRRYGDGHTATDIFLQRAALMVLDKMYTPSLEAIQGFFLMSLAEWGKNDKHRSSTHMGIAIRMAGVMRLHREETYYLPEDATADDIVASEVARRTFWMLENHDNLHSGYNSPVSFPLGDITTLLPCDEKDFAFGILSIDRAALMGTAPALENSHLTTSPSRSLFATLIQSHNLWGQVARRVAQNENVRNSHNKSPGFDTTLREGEYTRLSGLLQSFEDNLPSQHRWSIWNLRGFKAEGLDLAYISVVMMINLSNIILRRTYMDGICEKNASESHDTANQIGQGSSSDLERMIITELFRNLVVLHEQIEVFFSLRSHKQGFPVLLGFCIYICGSLANHLLQAPDFQKRATDTTSQALKILEASTKSLVDLQDAWPRSRRWSDALKAAFEGHALTTSGDGSGRGRGANFIAHQETQDTGNHGSTDKEVNLSYRNLDQEPQSVGFLESNSQLLTGLNAEDAVINNLMLTDVEQLQDSWTDIFSGPALTLTHNLDAELPFYLWPGGSV